MWRAGCSACGHVWNEKSARNFIDAVLDRRDMVPFGLLVFAAAVCVGTMALVGYATLSLYADSYGDASARAFGSFLVVVLIALVLIARIRTRA